MGHKDIRMTTRYAHLSNVHLEKTVETVYKNTGVEVFKY